MDRGEKPRPESIAPHPSLERLVTAQLDIVDGKVKLPFTKEVVTYLGGKPYDQVAGFPSTHKLVTEMRAPGTDLNKTIRKGVVEASASVISTLSDPEEKVRASVIVSNHKALNTAVEEMRKVDPKAAEILGNLYYRQMDINLSIVESLLGADLGTLEILSKAIAEGVNIEKVLGPAVHFSTVHYFASEMAPFLAPSKAAPAASPALRPKEVS